MKKDYLIIAIRTFVLTVVMTLFASCEEKTDYVIQDDVLYTLMDPQDVDGMEQRGDSLLKAGQDRKSVV